MTTVEERTAEYLQEMDSTVPGWFGAPDVELFQRVNLIQQLSGVRGSILEVGCYMGKSAILLGFLLNESESLVVNDLFDGKASAADNVDEVTREYPGLSEERFLHRYLGYHDQPPLIVADLSSTLPERLAGWLFRFIHIDGSHTYEVVREDLMNSRALAGEDAIVVMDDWRSEHTPGVSAAIWEAVTREGLIPLVVSPQKFYAMWSDGPAGVGGFLREWVKENYPDHHQSHWIAGHELVRIGAPPKPIY